jgi:hypothetical protein
MIMIALSSSKKKEDSLRIRVGNLSSLVAHTNRFRQILRSKQSNAASTTPRILDRTEYNTV